MRTRRATARRLAATGAAVLLVGGLAACGDEEPDGAATSTTTATGATTATTATSSGTASSSTTTAAELASIPVYWIAESRNAFALYREFRSVPDDGGPVASAVAAMTRMTPLDPDYMTPWRPASEVSVSQSGNAIEVDLSADAFANTNVGSELASRALQQLVYTATAAASQAGTPAQTVTVTMDGRSADVWGVLRLGEPMTRAPQAEVQAHAWVTSPQEGDELPAGTVTFKGFGTSFEANFTWKVTSVSGAVVAQGSAMGGTGTGGFGEFTFTADLAPGDYTVLVSTDDPSGGAEGAGPATDDKAFTVT